MDKVIELYGYSIKLTNVNYTKVEGSFSHNAASDMDYYGYEDLEFNVESITDIKSGETLKKADMDEVAEELDSEIASAVKLMFAKDDI